MNDAHLDDERTIAFALGDLAAPERQAAASHLGSCAACGQAVEQLVGLLAEERNRAGAKPPAHVLVQLLERQERARRRRASFWRPVPALAAAAVAAALFGAGFWQGRQASPAGPSPRAVTSTPAHGSNGLPTPPVVPVETAVAAGGDLAFSTAATPGAPGHARSLSSRGDSL